MNAMRCSVKRSSSPEPECTAIGAPGAAVARCPRKGRLPLAATAIGAPGAAAAHCPRRGRLPLAVAVNGHRAAPPLPASLAKERCNHDPPLPARWACSGLPVVSAVASVRWRAAHDRPPTSLPKWLCRAQSPLAVPRAAPASGAGPRATAVPVAARSRADRQSRPPPSAPSDPRPAPACAQPASPAREPRRPTTASPRACSCRSPAPPATAAAPFSESCTAAPGAAGGAACRHRRGRHRLGEDRRCAQTATCPFLDTSYSERTDAPEGGDLAGTATRDADGVQHGTVLGADQRLPDPGAATW